jgi:hypothetical protein
VWKTGTAKGKRESRKIGRDAGIGRFISVKAIA